MLRRAPSFRAAALGLLFFGLAGTMASACATGVGGEDDGDAGPSSGAGANTGNFTLVAPIDIVTAPAGYTIPVSFDHGTLVADGKSLANGDDVRVEFDDGSGPVEIDRILDDESAWDTVETTIFFKVQDTPGTYRLKYGNPLATDPPADGANVFVYYDTFDTGVLDEGWISSAMGTAITANTATVCPPECGMNQLEGTLRFEANTGTGDFGDLDGSGVDNVAFLHREITGDFIVEVRMEGHSNGFGGGSRVGGAMLRTSAQPDSVFGAIVQSTADQQRMVLTRADLAGAVDATNGPAAPSEMAMGGGTTAAPSFYRAQRTAGGVSFAYSDNGRLWTNLGAGVTIPDDTVLVGIPFANPASGSVQSVDIDWVRIRLGFDSEPIAQLGAEAAL